MKTLQRNTFGEKKIIENPLFNQKTREHYETQLQLFFFIHHPKLVHVSHHLKLRFRNSRKCYRSATERQDRQICQRKKLKAIVRPAEFSKATFPFFLFDKNYKKINLTEHWGWFTTWILDFKFVFKRNTFHYFANKNSKCLSTQILVFCLDL